MAFNRKETTLDGRHCALVGEVPVHDDVLTALDVFATFGDPDTPSDFKLAYAMGLMFPTMDPHDAESVRACARLLPDQCWELFGLDLTGGHEAECSGADVFDWDADEDMIRASFLSAYGMTVPELAEKCSYRDACSMLGLIPQDTPMGQALYYRVADEPERTEHNADQIRRFRELRDHYALSKSGADAYDAMNDAANAAFAGLGARRG